MLNACVSWTGDLGTESGVTRASTSLPRLFGEWIRAEDAVGVPAEGDEPEADDGGFNFQAEGAQPAVQAPVRQPDDFAPADPYGVSWRHCLFIPGVMHVVHNATEDFKNSLREWGWFVPLLRHVCRLLHKPERLLATVFNRAPHNANAHRFASFESTVYEGRWGEVLAACSELLPLKEPLRAAWDLRVYCFGQDPGPDHDQGGDDYGVKLGIANEAILSVFFGVIAP